MFPRLYEVTATELFWQKKSVNIPELHFCKAEALTPKCFCKDKRGDLAFSLSQTELSELLSTGAVSNSWEGKKKKKKEMNCFYNLHWSKNMGLKTNLTVAENSNQLLSYILKKPFSCK